VQPFITEQLAKPGGLAERLRSLRARSGLAGRHIATELGWPLSKVPKLEAGKQRPSDDDLRGWARVCGAPDAADELIQMAADARAAALDFKLRAEGGGVAVQRTINELIAQSSLVRHFDTTFMPGILQVRAYTEAILPGLFDWYGIDPGTVEASVDERMKRWGYLYDRSKRFEFVLAESALRWLLVPADVMAAQLDRLLTVAGLPNVRLGVVPFGVPLTMAPQHSFQLYDDLAMWETFLRDEAFRGGDAAKVAEAMDRLWADAVEGDEARALIVRAADALR
jgi:transcriptional regulator with XRE-family HTH domain